MRFEDYLKEEWLSGILPGFITVFFTSVISVTAGFLMGVFMGIIIHFFVSEPLSALILQALKEQRIIR